ncbi:hypothetical protein A3J78_02500 [Candidatus Beckwithbacteria bacterium RBG_13_35_6]|uniref:Ribbon-helix-helix protein CopG domain-containing protein n=1 Tax=Candidatus Beckwithbacteria bacterium RBG_13_35_6 TaxID=1797456 RepID=A0A1F5DG54_9BACT|nr:MAG: hypothetical protein A3J78_02500 [Candidatus Beckwithbacteria bacterium RBG_13_35_6]
MKYVVVKIRFPKEEWLEYKEMAAKENKSLSAWIRDSLKKGIKRKAVFGVDKEFSDWTDKFIKKYRPMLKELAKK